MTVYVLASNLGGGIARHLSLTGSVVPLEIHELSAESSLLDKFRIARRRLAALPGTVVVTHGVAAGIVARHRGRHGRSLRHVEVWHGDPFFLSPGRRAVYRVLARSGRAPDLQVFTHSWLVPMYRDARTSVEVLPNTVPLMPTEARPAGAVRRAVFVGRLSREKGLKELLAAWPVDSAERGWLLEIHGTGPLDQEVAPPSVTFCGASSNPLEVLTGADLVVIPSWTETGPYTACEAMSVGTPFIGTRTGDMPEFLTSGCGWEVPPRDVEALAAALRAAQSASVSELAARGDRGRSWLGVHRPFDAWAGAVQRIYAS